MSLSKTAGAILEYCYSSGIDCMYLRRCFSLRTLTANIQAGGVNALYRRMVRTLLLAIHHMLFLLGDGGRPISIFGLPRPTHPPTVFVLALHSSPQLLCHASCAGICTVHELCAPVYSSLIFMSASLRRDAPMQVASGCFQVTFPALSLDTVGR